MFETFELQYLNKLIESKVRDFTPPKPFHTVKVQRFGRDEVKPSAKVGGKFPMPVSTLVADFAIEYSECSDSTPPVIRTFDFTRYCFIEFPKCVQGLFQELWALYLFTSAKRQKGFQSEVYPYALTRSRQDFFACVISDNIKPVFSCSVSEDLDIADITLPVTVLMERIPDTVKLQRLCLIIPRFERDTETPILKSVSCWKFSRAHLVWFFQFRQTHLFATILFIDKKALVSSVKTDDNSVKCVSWYPSPVFF